MDDATFFSTQCITSVGGRQIDVFDPHPDMFDIEDIAHALAQQPRFGGHLKELGYSVAEHCINGVELVEDEYAYEFLMHDLSEGCGLLDLPRPIKAKLPGYLTLEDGVMRVLAEKFDFTYPKSPEVTKADDAMCLLERDGLQTKLKYFPFRRRSQENARDRFLELYHHLRP